MTQLEKISSIVGLIVVGAGAFMHFIILQGDVGVLRDEQQQIKINIDSNEKIIMDVKSYNKSITTEMKNVRNLLTHLQDRIDFQQNDIESKIVITHQLLTKIVQQQQRK